MGNETALKSLIILELDDFDKISLVETYADILKRKSNNTQRKITDIKKDELFLEFMESKIDVTDNTIKNYKSVLTNLLNYIYPKINKETMINFLKTKKSKWGLRTRRRNYFFIKNFLKFLFEMRYLDQDISEYVKIPKKVKILQYVPGDKEIESFFNALKKIYSKEKDKKIYYTIFVIYAKTGLRLNELINIDYKDIDFANRKIYLNKTKNHDTGCILIDQDLEKILLDYIHEFNIEGGALIRGKGGRRINKNVITNNLRRIIKEAGLPESFTAHAFRRYFIDKQRRSGIDIAVLKGLARHENINTTYEYFDVKDEEKLKAMENIRIAF